MAASVLLTKLPTADPFGALKRGLMDLFRRICDATLLPELFKSEAAYTQGYCLLSAIGNSICDATGPGELDQPLRELDAWLLGVTARLPAVN